MKTLKVPYVKQFNENSCGPAALEMVYRFFGLNNVSQEEIFNKYKKQNPESLNNDFYVLTQDLVEDAISQGFKNSYINRINLLDKGEILNNIQDFLKRGIPMIVCQQFTKELPRIGHFRIILGLSKNKETIYVHDPHPQFGGDIKKWSTDQFINFWKPTGDNVTGGIYIIVLK